MKYLLIFFLLPLHVLGQRLALDSASSVTHLNGIAYWYEPKDQENPSAMEVWNHPYNFPFTEGSRYQEFFNASQKPVFAQLLFKGIPGSLVYLVVDNANVDSLNLWYTYKGKTCHLETGSSMPQPVGMYPNPKFIFPIRMDGKDQKVLLRARTRKRLIIPLVLMKPPGGLSFVLRQIIPELIMLGMVLMLALYQLMRLLYSQSKQRQFYVLYLLALIGYAFLYLRGYGHFLGISAQSIITRLGVVLGGLAYLFAMLFAWHYLDRSKAPAWYLRLFKSAFILPVCTIVVDVAGFYQLSYNFLLAMGLTIPVFMLLFAGLVHRKGDIATKYFFAGWTSVSLSVMINSLLVMKIIDPSFKQIPQILLAFTCVEMLLLSVGMGYRASMVNKEKIVLQTQLLSLLQDQKENLEQQVLERTQDLKEALVRVEESDALKARLLSIISHDLRMPFVSLNAALDLLALNILTPEKAQQKLAKIKGNIRHIAGTLENLLTWSKHQQQNIETVPQPVFLKQMVRNVVALLDTNINSRNLNLVVDIEEEYAIWADPFQLETLLRNLMSNAIKASSEHTSLGVRCQPEKEAYRITIFDSGTGLQEPDLDAWLKNRSTLRDGSTLQSGLGLQICREFLANHQSELQYQHNGKGSEFSFVLPSAVVQEQPQAAGHRISS